MPSSAPLSGRRQRRFALFAQLVAVVLAVGAVVTVIAEGPGGHPAADRLAADEIASLPPLVAAPLPPSVSPSPSEAVASSPSPVLRAPGAVPSAGTGGFGYDARSGPVLGRAGELRRYRVAVESGSNEDAAEFALAVQTALAGPGSWVDSGRLRLQQVPGAAPRDFTVYLATARTAGRMCADGGVDIRVGGRPYTSCRARPGDHQSGSVAAVRAALRLGRRAAGGLPDVRGEPRGGSPARASARALPGGGQAGAGDDAADAVPQRVPGQPVAVPRRASLRRSCPLTDGPTRRPSSPPSGVLRQ
ncbi:uncharacterized protein DUF3152 [Micromonospora sp. A202]|nr:uncharacterized protein DUF3152 [Micromonospora sp. A202]